MKRRATRFVSQLVLLTALALSSALPAVARAEPTSDWLFERNVYRSQIADLADKNPAVRLSALLRIEKLRRWIEPEQLARDLERYRRRGLTARERVLLGVLRAELARDRRRAGEADSLLQGLGFVNALERCDPARKSHAALRCQALTRPRGVLWFSIRGRSQLVRFTVPTRTRRTALRLAFRGTIEVIDGARLRVRPLGPLRGDVPPTLDTISLELSLPRGQTTVVLRLTPTGGRSRFALRLTRDRDDADAALRAGRRERERLERRLRRRATPELRRRVDRLRIAELRLELSLATSVDRRQAARKLALAGALSTQTDPERLVLALELLRRRSEIVRLASRLEALAHSDPRGATLLVALALRQNRALRAAQELARLLRRFPLHAPLLALRLDLALRRQLLPALAGLRRELETRAALAPTILERLIECAIDQGDRRRALRLNTRLIAAEFGTLRHHLRNVQLRRELGDHRGALAAIRTAIAEFPDVPLLRLREADVLLALGDWRRAETLLLAAVNSAIGSRALRALGQLYLKTGRKADALRAFERTLSAEPTDLDLRLLVARLRGTNALRPFARGYEIDPQRVLQRPLPPRRADEPALINAYRLTAVYLYPSGAADRVHQWIQRILDPSALPAKPSFEILYNPFNQRLTIVRARVLRRGSQDLAPLEIDERPVTSTEVAIYYDFRKRVITFPALARGDVIEVLYRLDEHEAPFIPGYFGELHTFAEHFPTAEARFVLDHPQGLSIHYRYRAPKTSVQALETATKRYGKRRVELFRTTAVAGLFELERTPSLGERSPTLHVSTIESWPELARRYRRFIGTGATGSPQPSVRQTALRLTRTLTSERERVVAIHRFVAQSIRYVGLEFGVHGYKPYSPATVLARRFGDCKDKATLMRALLAAIGIRSHLVLVRTSDLGPIAPQPASLAVFNHAMLYLPTLRAYTDPTSTYHAFGELPLADQDATVLVLDGSERIRRTPPPRAADNQLLLDFELRRKTKWSFEISGRLDARGSYAARWRRQLNTIGERRRALERLVQERFPGARLLTFQAPSIARLEPVAIGFRASWSPIEDDASAIRIETPIRPALVPDDAELKRRGTPWLSPPFHRRERITLHLDKGLSARFGGTAASWRLPVLVCELVRIATPGRLTVALTTTVRHRPLPAEGVAELRRALASIVRVLGSSALLLERKEGQ